MASANPSAMLAESLSDFSKAAYKALTEVEIQARQEVTRAVNETREVRQERDKTLKELHNNNLELHAWKQELAASKASLAQAELTISHQTQTLADHAETISQLRRELAQWKDQSRNWQEHFLRVEQERCNQALRIDELVVEKLQHARQLINSNGIYTPKGSKYADSAGSAPSSTTTKRPSVPSPTQPPAYRTAHPSTSEEFEQARNVSATKANYKPRTPKNPKASTKSRYQEPAVDDVQGYTSSASKRPRKNTPAHTPRIDHPLPPRHSTVIRHVHAVISVKSEESEGEAPNLSTSIETQDSSRAVQQSGGSSTRRNRTRSRPVRDESDYDSEDSRSGSDQPRRLRNRRQINYEEDEYEDGVDEEEDDELMLGANDAHNYGDSLSGLSAQEERLSKKRAAPPKKKRKVLRR